MDNEFRTPLRAICTAMPGAVAATLMGSDGIPVETVQAEPNEVDVGSLLVEYAALLDQVRRSAQMFEAGSLEELAIASEHLTTIIRPLNPEYFLALALTPAASAGKGRYLLRIHAPQLIEALD
jgi:predicted regulator of Ras-like GTPase activity (Roadblock/LC7/MglB family)